MKNSKTILSTLLACFLLLSCGSFKKTTSIEKTKKITEKTKESKIDSMSVTEKSSPTESELVYDLNDLSKTVGDFVQKMNSGNGNETEIKKQGSKIYIKSKNAGSTNTKTNVKKEEKETIYNSEFVLKEIKTVIKRIPFKFWLIIILLILIKYRKFLSQILCSIFPVLRTKRIFLMFLGEEKKI